MKTDDLKKTEEDVLNILNSMQPAHKIVMYKTLYNEGQRMSNVDDDLRKIKEYKELTKNEKTESTPVPYGYWVV